jgi:hypothetical protein
MSESGDIRQQADQMRLIISAGSPRKASPGDACKVFFSSTRPLDRRPLVFPTKRHEATETTIFLPKFFFMLPAAHTENAIK